MSLEALAAENKAPKDTSHKYNAVATSPNPVYEPDFSAKPVDFSVMTDYPSNSDSSLDKLIQSEYDAITELGKYISSKNVSELAEAQPTRTKYQGLNGIVGGAKSLFRKGKDALNSAYDSSRELISSGYDLVSDLGTSATAYSSNLLENTKTAGKLSTYLATKGPEAALGYASNIINKLPTDKMSTLYDNFQKKIGAKFEKGSDKFNEAMSTFGDFMSNGTIRARKGAANAFTLIELLVVISITSVLIGLLLPALAGARKRVNDLNTEIQIREVQTMGQSFNTTYQVKDGEHPWLEAQRDLNGKYSIKTDQMINMLDEYGLKEKHLHDNLRNQSLSQNPTIGTIFKDSEWGGDGKNILIIDTRAKNNQGKFLFTGSSYDITSYFSLFYPNVPKITEKTEYLLISTGNDGVMNFDNVPTPNNDDIILEKREDSDVLIRRRKEQ